MSRYCSHTIIMPDETMLDNHVVEVADKVIACYPFAGEMHTTLYLDTPILLSHRADLEGKTVSLAQLTWALRDADSADDMYAYRLDACPSCMGDRYALTKIR